MQNKPIISQEWSVHAQLTISHQPHGNVSHFINAPRIFTDSQNFSSVNNNQAANNRTFRPSYGFQRGNILFTTSPPTQRPDSGYNSENVTSGVYGSLPTRKPSQTYNRRCKSTCNIVLSNIQTGSQHSLTYQCSDPTCYSPTPEACEVCGGGRSPNSLRRASKGNTFTTHFCTHVPGKQDADTRESKDASSQTSPLLDDGNVNNPRKGRSSSKVPERRKTDTDLLQIPVLEVGDTSGRKKSGKRLSRSPARLRGTSPLRKKSQCVSTEDHKMYPELELSKGKNRKPKTVHIDVYCTGSEDADASESTDTETGEDSWSSPQTVFESDKWRVLHTRARRDQLPLLFQKQAAQRSVSLKYKPSESSVVDVSSRGYDSDDVLSTVYPSKQSSYATFSEEQFSLLSEARPSRDSSWSTISSYSCPPDCDSVSATSWKDTATEIESVLHSTLSLAQSDSFDYADALDKLRIREKERAWAGEEAGKNWRSPQGERKHLLQQQKFKEFMERHSGKAGFPLWKPEPAEDSEDDDDETGDAWSFSQGDRGSPNNPGLKREDTIIRTGKDNASTSEQSCDRGPVNRPIHRLSCGTNVSMYDTGSLSDSGPPPLHRFAKRAVIGPFGVKPPSPPPPKIPNSIVSPFTTFWGQKTDHLLKAEKFGTIIGTLKKPGHHVGPSKNPDCTCVHCQKYYEEAYYRNRTLSVGDMPVDRDSWKQTYHNKRNTSRFKYSNSDDTSTSDHLDRDLRTEKNYESGDSSIV